MTKNVLVLGCDGFCGWPTLLHLAARGYQVYGVDSGIRRDIDEMRGWDSLTPIASPEDRGSRAKMQFGNIDRLLYGGLEELKSVTGLRNMIDKHEIDTVIHLAEQRSAPYSMRDIGMGAYTIRNNIQVTSNVLLAIKVSKRRPHLVHLGTMGVYGYGKLGKITTPEGYLDATFASPFGDELKTTAEILHPMYPGSIYHMTKCMDHIMFQFFAQNDGLRITDLHQGIVWGTQTAETMMDPDLINRFDYDGDFGTVLNRFLVQAALDMPSTVYGTGEQTRAIIHISDTVRCIRMAVDNPPGVGERPAIYNQVAETASVLEMAQRVDAITRNGYVFNVNPRKEAARNDLIVDNTGFKSLGWKPVMMTDDALEKEFEIAARYSSRAKRDTIMPEVRW